VHIIHGQKGVGYIVRRIQVYSQLWWGEQRKGIRPGQEAVHSAGIAKALELSYDRRREGSDF
jgi:cysteine sulfinate desulfinase/cysteine desulfurase-like protein